MIGEKGDEDRRAIAALVGSALDQPVADADAGAASDDPTIAERLRVAQLESAVAGLLNGRRPAGAVVPLPLRSLRVVETVDDPPPRGDRDR